MTLFFVRRIGFKILRGKPSKSILKTLARYNKNLVGIMILSREQYRSRFGGPLGPMNGSIRRQNFLHSEFLMKILNCVQSGRWWRKPWNEPSESCACIDRGVKFIVKNQSYKNRASWVWRACWALSELYYRSFILRIMVYCFLVFFETKLKREEAVKSCKTE